MKTVRFVLIVGIVLGVLGSSVGVLAQAATPDTMAPVFVTGTEQWVSEWSERTTTSEGSLTVIEGVGLTGIWEASDPRLSGTATYAATYDRFESAGFEVEASSRVVVNDGGRWVGTSTALSTAPETSPQTNTDTVLLRGEGAYEGLTAYVVVDSTTDPATFVAGVFPGDMPAQPPLPASE